MSNFPNSPNSWEEESEPEELPYTSESEPEELPPTPPTLPEPAHELHIEVGESSSSQEQPAPTLASLAAALKRAELSLSFMTNMVDRMGRQMEAMSSRHLDMQNEILSLRAQVARGNIPPPGLSNQEISDRIDLMDHHYHNFRDNVDHDIAHLVGDLTTLQMRVDGMEHHAQEAQMAALVNPPPEAEGDEDAQSDISDAMEP